MTPISKPYNHGSQWRCRTRTPDGWRWCSSADSPAAATLLAQGGPVPATQEVQGEPLPPALQVPPAAQPPQVPDPIRIQGPFRKGSGWRCSVVLPTGRQFTPTARTRERAYKVAEHYVEQAARQGRHSVAQAIAGYLQHGRDKGNRPTSIAATGYALRRFFAPVLQSEMVKLTPQKGADLYDRLRRDKTPAGKPLAVDSHRNYLLQARSFCSWCVERCWLPRNPLEKVKGVGACRRRPESAAGCRKTRRPAL